MQKQNLSEYEFIRKELAGLRNCITTYMGFVIGGSGIAFFITTSIIEGNKISDNAVLAFFISSLIISMVLMILFYKFNSHNRYSGYCKLLNQERYEGENTIDQFLSWEVCMDVLREADDNNEVVINKAHNMRIIGVTEDIVEKLKGIYEKKSFTYKVGSGLFLLLKTFFGLAKSKSWNFPLYVTAVFFSLTILLILCGLYYWHFSQISVVPKDLLLYSVITISGLQIFIWCLFLNKLYELMEGKRTVESYCWRFLPIRYEYIKKFNPEINYRLITLKQTFYYYQ